MYQDLIIPTIYTPIKTLEESMFSTKIEADRCATGQREELLRRLKILSSMIEGRSACISKDDVTQRDRLIQEFREIQKQLDLMDTSMAKFKHRVEVHKIPVTLKHKNKQELDNGIHAKNNKIPVPPTCIHYDAPKIGKSTGLRGRNLQNSQKNYTIIWIRR